MDFELTKKVLTALEREDVQYIVFGAVAVNLLGLARATEGLDIFIAPNRENVEGLRAAVEFDGMAVSVATPQTLYRMKKGTGRPRDWGDAADLEARYGLKDE